MKTIIIFGANGFIGRSLVNRLSKDSTNSIIAFDRRPFEGEGSLNIRSITGDFFDKETYRSALESADYVFHFVATTNPALSVSDPVIDIETNLRGSVELLLECVRSGVKKVIFPSSGGSVYGDLGVVDIDEEMAPQPVSPYGITKLTIEHYLRYFKTTYGLDYIVYRISNPFGPGQNIEGSQGVIPIFMNKILNGEPINVYGDGSMVRDYIYIDDVAESIAVTFSKDNNYAEYNLGSSKGMSINEIIEKIERLTSMKAVINQLKSPASFVHHNVLSMERFRSEFGMSSTTNFELGLKRTWEYVKKANE